MEKWECWRQGSREGDTISLQFQFPARRYGIRKLNSKFRTSILTRSFHPPSQCINLSLSIPFYFFGWVLGLGSLFEGGLRQSGDSSCRDSIIIDWLQCNFWREMYFWYPPIFENFTLQELGVKSRSFGSSTPATGRRLTAVEGGVNVGPFFRRPSKWRRWSRKLRPGDE